MPEGGFTYFRSGAEREGDAAPEPQAPEPDESDAGDDYPSEGTIPAVKRWVGEDVDRAQQAYDLESDRDTPRSTLLEWLEDMLSEPDDEE